MGPSSKTLGCKPLLLGVNSDDNRNGNKHIRNSNGHNYSTSIIMRIIYRTQVQRKVLCRKSCRKLLCDGHSPGMNLIETLFCAAGPSATKRERPHVESCSQSSGAAVSNPGLAPVEFGAPSAFRECYRGLNNCPYRCSSFLVQL